MEIGEECRPDLQVVSFDVGIKHFAYCIMHEWASGTAEGTASQTSTARRVERLEIVTLADSKRATTQDLVSSCIELLDTIYYQQLREDVPVVVLIECQMTSKMKCIQTVINCFFKMIAKYNGADITTRYLSAKHKLSIVSKYKDFPGNLVATEPGTATSGYKKNKQDSVAFALWLLEHKEQDVATMEIIQKAKKKDDLTDAYLMCIYHADMVGASKRI